MKERNKKKLKITFRFYFHHVSLVFTVTTPFSLFFSGFTLLILYTFFYSRFFFVAVAVSEVDRSNGRTTEGLPVEFEKITSWKIAHR